jgi:hypothetical protein
MTISAAAPTDTAHSTKLEAARRFLIERGITDVKPLYGSARRASGWEPSALGTAQARWFARSARR